MAASPPASSSPPPPPSAADGDGDAVGGGGARCSSPTPAARRRSSPNRSGGSARKSSGSRDFLGGSVLKSVNKSTSQFKKSRYRRSGSPINWTPRKKTESYMKRKIKHLQEIDGLTASLHETLGNANPHYTRMAREKIAAREAARKATEARKAAMVEASWCRILQAARIQNKYAEDALEKATLRATEAFEEARAMGVMMYDRPDCPDQQYEVESSSHRGRSTHKFTASFQTAFQVDMEVAAAVRKAFLQLAKSPDSSKKEEFKELLWKISQNPDLTETDVNSEGKQQLDECSDGDTSNLELNKENFSTSSISSCFNTTDVPESIDVVNIMLERLKALREDELASLAVIVATSGLNAALQSDRGKYHETEAVNSISAGSLRLQSRRYSTAASFLSVHGPKEETNPDLPSLDKFLVKHLSKLEREVQEAREASRKSASVKYVTERVVSQFTGSNAKAPESELGSILVKHVSKLEREILEAKKKSQSTHPGEESCNDVKVSGKIDVQPKSTESEFDKPQPEAETNSDLKGNCSSRESGENISHIQGFSDHGREDKENQKSYSNQLPPSGAKGIQGGKRLTRIEAAKLEALKSFCMKDGNTSDLGLDKVFIKPVHRLEKEKREAREGQSNVRKHPQKHGQSTTVTGSLDDILVKHVSRLEREKIEYEKRNASGEGSVNMPRDQQKHANNATSSESLDQVLVKHVSRLEREKIEHEKKGGMMLVKKSPAQQTNVTAGSLTDIFVKRPTKLEQAKLASAAEETSVSGLNPVQERRRAREKELLDTWGGMGLGNSMKPHVSKIERDKANWREDEQKHICATTEL
ncbi:hypothetical protein ACP70R_045639 [Stipagrostis hirtigluma subsp. patula]